MSLVWPLAPKVRRFGAIIAVYTAGWIVGGLIRPHVAMPANGFVRFILYFAVSAVTALLFDFAIKRIFRIEERVAKISSEIAMYFFIGLYLQLAS